MKKLKQIIKNNFIDTEVVALCLKYINDKKVNPATLVFNINEFNEFLSLNIKKSKNIPEFEVKKQKNIEKLIKPYNWN